MEVITIIVTYNGAFWISKCIESVHKSSLISKLIIIDNASSDDTIEIIKRKFPSTVLIESPVNSGFGQANNIGIRYAIDNNADYAFLLNQDARIEPGSIEKLVSTHKNNPGFGILSPLHLSGAGDSLDKKFSYYAGAEYTEDFLSDLCLNQVSDIYETKFVNAAAWLVSVECLKKVGGFDPIFFHYGEDYNYCQRATYHGLKIGIVPSAKIYHDRVYKEDKYDSKQILLHYLLTVANINNSDYQKDYKKLKQQDLIRIFTGMLRGDFEKTKQNIRNFRSKKNLFSQVKESRKKNKTGGLIYL